MAPVLTWVFTDMIPETSYFAEYAAQIKVVLTKMAHIVVEWNS